MYASKYILHRYLLTYLLYYFTVKAYSFIICNIGPPRLWNLEKFSILLVYQVHFLPTRLRVFCQNHPLLVYYLSSFIRQVRVVKDMNKCSLKSQNVLLSSTMNAIFLSQSVMAVMLRVMTIAAAPPPILVEQVKETVTVIQSAMVI